MVNFAQIFLRRRKARRNPKNFDPAGRSSGLVAKSNRCCRQCRLDQYPSFRIYTRICPPPNSAKLAKGALDLAARFAVILAPSFRPFSRVNWAVKDAGESTAKSLIFGRSVSRAFGGGPLRG